MLVLVPKQKEEKKRKRFPSVPKRNSHGSPKENGQVKMDVFSVMNITSCDTRVPFLEVNEMQREDSKGQVIINLTTELIPTDKDYTIRYGTLAGLVSYMTHPDFCDVEFRSIFLMTYRLFSYPHEILSFLEQRYQDAISMGPEGPTVQIRVFSTIKAWIEANWQTDFAFDPEVSMQLNEIISAWGPKKDQIKALIDRVQRPAIQRLPSHYPESFPPTEKLDSKYIRIGSIPVTEMARQLAIKGSRIFVSIKYVEFLSSNWCSENRTQEAPNITKLITFFNTISSWATQNVIHKPKLKDRLEVLTWMISLAEESMKLNDLNTTAAIIQGLSHPSINRLHRTWESLDQSWQIRWKQVKNLTDDADDYHVLRYHLLRCDPPLVPLIGLHLRDYIFLDKNAPTFAASSLVNFEKCLKIGKLLRDVEQYQKFCFAYTYNELPEVQEWIDSWPDEPFSSLMSRSIVIEPTLAEWENYEKLLEVYDEQFKTTLPSVEVPKITENSSRSHTPSPHKSPRKLVRSKLSMPGRKK